ncbi:class I SAM-dependent methyltransferase, partial [Micromonospora sp. LOL_023]|uniref:class I SAM-dependent methyltransferase n=1 Tax=Micromonospora sp. LOL_023 TaxID=3345418 RepID=UPI003A8A317B
QLASCPVLNTDRTSQAGTTPGPWQKQRIRQAYQGSFVDLATDLAGRYDVISMYHYLEHTADPKRQLAAAAVALSPGGHLAIELPDPDFAWAKALGRWWISWLQPQHLHMIPIANLRTVLAGLGFEVIAEQRSEPHNKQDVVSAAILAINAALIGGEDLAWRPAPPSRAAAVFRKIAFTATAPALAVAVLVDRVSAKIGGNRGCRTRTGCWPARPPDRLFDAPGRSGLTLTR